MWPFRLQVGGLFPAGLLSTPLTLLTPVPLAALSTPSSALTVCPAFLLTLPRLVAIENSDTALLVAAAVMFVLIALLTQLQSMATLVLQASTGERMRCSPSAPASSGTSSVSLSYHDKRGTTDSTYRIQYDATAIQWMATDTITSFVTSAFTLIAMLT